MTRTRTHRRTAAVAALTLALGTAAPASARPNLDPGPAPAPDASVTPAAGNHQGNGTNDWTYVAIGSGAASVILIGAGGTLVAGRRRHAGAPRRSTISA